MDLVSQRDKDLFENFFVLELANNHWGKLDRGLKIIRDHAAIVRFNNVKAAIKLQFRDVDAFIHQDYKGSAEQRYIKKTEDTKLSREDFARMVEEVKYLGCVPMATPFDEASVDLCVEFDMPIIKIASSDMNDWVLIEKIASTRRPTIVSTGGASEKDLDDLVHFFEKRDIPLSINHCVSLYPSEDSELELDQIKRAKAAQLAESYRFVQQEVAMTRPMAAQKVISDVELLRLERQASDIKGELDATRLAIPRLEASLQEGRNKVEGAQAKFRADASMELSQARAELEGTSASTVAMADRLERTTVRSPVNGIIKTIKVTTVGGVIQPGSDVMEIVPIEDNLLVEARVRPADIAFLRPGQPAVVKVTAYDYSIYGGLAATVETITADSITNDKGESFYLVRVRTATNRFGSSATPLPIIPGMLTTVHIQTGSKSVLRYLLKPIIKARSEALRER